MRKSYILAAATLGFLALSPLIWREQVKRNYLPFIFEQSEVPTSKTAIVFGAAVFRNGRLSTVLRDRMDMAIRLYHDGKVNRLLLSGSKNGNYDEPGAMARYAVANGIASEHLIQDPMGLRTYDTCYRAHELFGLNEAVLVTQAYHLPRALFTCNQLGLESVGVASDFRIYRAAGWYETREIFATTVALFDVALRRQPPVELAVAGQIFK